MTDTKDLQKRYVLCGGCGNKIHESHFAGVAKIDGETKFFCNSTPCLLGLADRLTERNDLAGSDQDTNAEAVKSAQPTPKRNK